ncbi:MAG: hypothetical protein KF777_15835 [Planctomycetaceae bacterium]|nr:hypothetical protein [Planctomycetaceae bacterium]
MIGKTAKCPKCAREFIIAPVSGFKTTPEDFDPDWLGDASEFSASEEANGEFDATEASSPPRARTPPRKPAGKQSLSDTREWLQGSFPSTVMASKLLDINGLIWRARYSVWARLGSS